MSRPLVYRNQWILGISIVYSPGAPAPPSDSQALGVLCRMFSLGLPLPPFLAHKPWMLWGTCTREGIVTLSNLNSILDGKHIPNPDSTK